MAVTDARGQTTSFAYNGVGQLIRRTNPLGQVTTFTYDLARNLVLTVDAKGQRLEFSYDAANQLVQKVLKDAAGVVTDTVTLAYDPLGSLASAADADSHLTFTTDALGRVTQVQTAATSAQPASTIGYTYDLSGNRVTMMDPRGAVTASAYDALNRLTSVTSPAGTTTVAYDALGRRTSLTRPNGTQTTATYDAASQLTDLVHTAGVSTLSRFAYTYDAVGNRATRTTPTGVAAYTYDGLNRLTQAQQPDPVDPLQVLTETFAYDPVGNRTASHLATGQLYDAANRLLEDSAFTYQYDLTGNLTSKTAKATGAATTYTYDVENRLVAVTGPGLTAGYAYDPLGRRIAKTVNGVATRYAYDQEDMLLEYDGANVPQVRYTHGPGIDEPLARVDVVSGQTVFYHADGLGSLTELTDGSGAVVQRYSYDAFGAILASPGTVTQPYTFTGREFDPETGLYYYRARYYDSTTGRLLQEDPIGFAGGINFYAYVKNNPVNVLDPFGLLDASDIIIRVIKGLGRANDVIGTIFDTSGPGATTGAAIGGAAGAVGGGIVGAAGGPVAAAAGAVAGGIIVGSIGAFIGEHFDDPCAGLLNCGEDDRFPPVIRAPRPEIPEIRAPRPEPPPLPDIPQAPSRACDGGPQ